jgi:hypothetical protein
MTNFIKQCVLPAALLVVGIHLLFADHWLAGGFLVYMGALVIGRNA